MANNKSIQILRGNSAQIVAAQANEQDTDKLLPGQMLYNTDKGYLTIGSNENNSYTQEPIKVRELIGYEGDSGSNIAAPGYGVIPSYGIKKADDVNELQIYTTGQQTEAPIINISSQEIRLSGAVNIYGSSFNAYSYNPININSSGNISLSTTNTISETNHSVVVGTSGIDIYSDRNVEIDGYDVKVSSYGLNLSGAGGGVNINSSNNLSINSNTMSVKALGDINIISSPSNTPLASINLSSGKAILTSENGMELNAYSGGLNMTASTGGKVTIYGDGGVGISSFSTVNIAANTAIDINSPSIQITSTAVLDLDSGNKATSVNCSSLLIKNSSSSIQIMPNGALVNGIIIRNLPSSSGTLALKSDIQPNYYTHYVRMIGDVGSTSIDLTFWYQGTSNSTTTILGSIAAQLYESMRQIPVPCTGRVTPSGQSQTGAYSIYARTSSSLQYYTINSYVGNITGDPTTLAITHYVYNPVKTY